MQLDLLLSALVLQQTGFAGCYNSASNYWRLKYQRGNLPGTNHGEVLEIKEPQHGPLPYAKQIVLLG